MNFLVTGGAGFIGSNIVEALVNLKHTVRVLDNFSTGKRENLTPFMDAIDLVEGDIRSATIAAEAVKGIDVVLHQAALPSVPRSVKDPVTTNEVNVGGTLNILTAAREAGVKRFIYASSSSIYGSSPELPKHENMSPAPLSPYAVSKLAGEQYCRVFARIYGLKTACLRYFNVFGPRQDPDSQYSAAIPRFIMAMMRNDRPIIYGDGDQTRDFTYVANVVEANLLAVTADCDTDILVNCAGHERTSINRLVKEINSILGTSIQPQYAEPRLGDVRDSYASIVAAKKSLNYNPIVTFREGLRMTIEWYRSHGTWKSNR